MSLDGTCMDLQLTTFKGENKKDYQLKSRGRGGGGYSYIVCVLQILWPYTRVQRSIILDFNLLLLQFCPLSDPVKRDTILDQFSMFTRLCPKVRRVPYIFSVMRERGFFSFSWRVIENFIFPWFVILGIKSINLILRPREFDFWLLRDPWNM